MFYLFGICAIIVLYKYDNTKGDKMKKLFKLILTLFLFFPIMVFGAVNYADGIISANEYISKFSDYQKYIVSDHFPYDVVNNKLVEKSNFKTGGFLSKEEYNISFINGSSYLAPGIEYWTLTQSAADLVYVINVLAEEKSAYSKSGVRTTQFVKNNTIVTGDGTHGNPWEFLKLIGISFMTDNNVRGLVSLKPCSEGQSKEVIKFNLEPDNRPELNRSGYHGYYYICPKTGYKYYSSTCSNIIYAGNNQYEIININNDNLVCIVSFTFDTKSITLDDCDKKCVESPQKPPSALYYSSINRYWYTDTNGINRINKLVALPMRNGYAFQGYVIADGSSDYVIDSNGNFIDKDLSGIDKIYPSFKANQYEITLNSDNATVPGTNKVTATFDSPMPKIEVPSKNYTVTLNPNGGEGSISSILSEYKLDGFYYGTTKYYTSTGESATNWDKTSNTTLNAKWIDGGITLPTPSRKGYSFDGWYTAASGGTKVNNSNQEYFPNNDITLYAHWNINSYPVTLDGNGATSTDHTKSITATYGNTMPAITKPTRSYNITYSLDGASYTPTNENTKVIYTFKGYDYNGVQYYNANGASARNWDKTSSATLVASWDSGCATLPSLSKNGYDFNGWYTSSSGGTKAGSGGECYTIDKNITLYAKFTPKTYKLTLNSSGATPSSQTINAVFGSHLPTVSVPVKKYIITYNLDGGSNSPSTATSSYNFGGFYYNSNQYITASGTSARIWNQTTNATLSAQWSCNEVVLPTPQKSGYIFDSWYDASTGGSKVGNAGDKYCASSNITLYSRWTASKYTVDLDDNGGSGGSGSVIATYGSAMPSIKKPTRSYTITYNLNGGSGSQPSSVVNYTFNGYYYNNSVQYYNSIPSSVRNWDMTSGVTLKAKWTGGSITLPTPTRSGYSFKGWYTAATGGSKVADGGQSYSPTANITLYAQWQGEQYSLSFDANGASSVGTTSVTATYGSAMPSITKPTKSFSITFDANGGSVDTASATATYSFGGYYYNNVQYYKSDGTSARNWNVLSSATLTASWSNGGIQLPSGNRNGYALEGWYTAATGGTKLGGVGDTYYPTIGGKIYAHWSKTTNVVILDDNGGSGGSGSVVATSAQPMPTVKKPTKSFNVILDYNGNGTSSSTLTVASTFNGYYLDSTQYYKSDGTSARNWDKISDVTLKAKWTGGSTGTLPNPTRTGYSFAGWYTEKNYGGTKAASGGGTYTPSSNITLYARWNANTYSVKYDCNGGSNPMSNSSHVYGVSSSLTTNTCAKTGNQFASWNTKADGSGTTYSNGASVSTLSSSYNGVVTLYAQWTPITYYVEFASNGGTGTMNKMTFLYGETKNLLENNFSKSGYNFSVWSGSNGRSYSNKQSVSNLSETNGATIKMTAQWDKRTYTISYNANGGSGAPSSQTKTHDVALTLSDTIPSRDGYVFQGWGTSSTATSATYTAGGSYTANSGTTLYAVWKANTYTVSYNANGGSGAPSAQTKTYGVTLTLSSTKPTRDGYVFQGWGTSSTTTTVSYLSGASYTANSGTTLYAVWKQNAVKYTISFNPVTDTYAGGNMNGGSVVSATYGKKSVSNMPSSVTGATVTIPDNVPTAVGTDPTGKSFISWTFKGWTTQDAITGASNVGLKVVTAEYQPGDTIKLSKDTTLYAVWYWTYGIGGFGGYGS